MSRSLSMAITSTRHLGSHSKPETISRATVSWPQSASSCIIVYPSLGTAIAHWGLSWSTLKLTCARDTLVSKLDRPSS